MTGDAKRNPILAEAFTAKALRQINSLPVDVDFSTEEYMEIGLVDVAGFNVRADTGDEEPPTGQGYGTQAMKSIVHNADVFGIDLEVYAGVTQDGCDPVRLIGFYSRFGFVLQNPDTWRDEGWSRPHLIRRALSR